MPILRWQSRVPYDPATVHPRPNLERRLGSQECRVRWSAQLTKIAFHLLFVMLMSGAIQAQTTPASPVSGNKSVNGNAAASSTNSQDKTTGVAAVTASPDTDQHLALLHLIESLEPYQPKANLKGSAVLSGSTTMQTLSKAWTDRFRQFHPEVTFTKGKEGTEGALEEISQNPNVIGGASRPLTESELAGLKSNKCKEPMAVIVALDPLALYVHRDNPLSSVTPQQLESIFRASGKGKPSISKWGDLGLTGDWKDQLVRVHSRSDVSGTTGFIKQWVLGGDDLTKSAQVHETNHDVTKGVGGDKLGVALSGFGESNPSVRSIPLVINGVAIEANETNFLAGRYPFVRPLMLVIDKEMLKQDGGLRESILRYVLSRDGQLEAVRAGFYPLDPAFIRKQLDSISGPQVR